MNYLLTSAYLGPVQYYCRLIAGSHVLEEHCDHYVKQTYRNRCVIASESGPLALVVPIVRKGNDQPMRDVEISDHGRWRALHWAAITSAYERSPYFEFYADDFRPFYEHPCRFLLDFNTALRELVCNLLDLTPDIQPTPYYIKDVPPDTTDCRELISPKRPTTDDPAFRATPYYQVFAGRNGFLPNLSIIDLLFNMGPEARGVLRSCLCG